MERDEELSAYRQEGITLSLAGWMTAYHRSRLLGEAGRGIHDAPVVGQQRRAVHAAHGDSLAPSLFSKLNRGNIGYILNKLGMAIGGTRHSGWYVCVSPPSSHFFFCAVRLMPPLHFSFPSSHPFFVDPYASCTIAGMTPTSLYVGVPASVQISCTTGPSCPASPYDRDTFEVKSDSTITPTASATPMGATCIGNNFLVSFVPTKSGRAGSLYINYPFSTGSTQRVSLPEVFGLQFVAKGMITPMDVRGQLFRFGSSPFTVHRSSAGPDILNCALVSAAPTYIMLGVPQQITFACKDLSNNALPCQSEWATGFSLGISPSIELHMLGAYCNPTSSNSIVMEFRLDGIVEATATLTAYYKGVSMFTASSIAVISPPACVECSSPFSPRWR